MLLLRYWLVKEMEKEVLTLHGNEETGFYVVNAELVSKAQYEPMLLWIAYVCFVCYQDPLVESGFFLCEFIKIQKNSENVRLIRLLHLVIGLTKQMREW